MKSRFSPGPWQRDENGNLIDVDGWPVPLGNAVAAKADRDAALAILRRLLDTGAYCLSDGGGEPCERETCTVARDAAAFLARTEAP